MPSFLFKWDYTEFGSAFRYINLFVQHGLSGRDGLVDWLCKPFQAPGAHVADYSKPVKPGEENSVMPSYMVP